MLSGVLVGLFYGGVNQVGFSRLERKKKYVDDARFEFSIPSWKYAIKRAQNKLMAGSGN